MPNTIALAKNYVPLLDEVYKRESVTSDLTGDPAMVKAGANAKEIVYPQIAVSETMTATAVTRRERSTSDGRPLSTIMIVAPSCPWMRWTIRRALTLLSAWQARN